MKKAKTASKINTILRDCDKRQSFIRNLKRNMGQKGGDNILNLDYHTLVTYIAFESLLLLFLNNLKFHTNSDNTTLGFLNILYEFFTFVSTIQKCTTAK